MREAHLAPSQVAGSPRCRQATVEEGTIRCDTCGEPADTLHFLPWVVAYDPDERRIEAACPQHDPGGYWLRIEELRTRPLHLLMHLSEKRQAPHAALVEWLGYAGAAVLDRLRAAAESPRESSDEAT